MMAHNLLTTPSRTVTAPPAPMTPEMKRVWLNGARAQVPIHDHIIKKLIEKSEASFKDAMKLCNEMVTKDDTLSESIVMINNMKKMHVAQLSSDMGAAFGGAIGTLDVYRSRSVTVVDLGNDLTMLERDCELSDDLQQQQADQREKLQQLQKLMMETEEFKKKAKEEEIVRDQLLEMICEVEGESTT